MASLPSRLLDAAASVASFGADFSALPDEQLVTLLGAVDQLDRLRGVYAASVAGELRARSGRQFGDSGLAQRLGFIDTQSLIQSITGAPRTETAKQVAVGTALDSPVGAALLDGRISLDAAATIQRNLGPKVADSDLAASEFTAATERLIEHAQGENVDRLAKRARAARDLLDADSVARREREQRELRYLRVYRRGDGMVRGSFLLDPLDGGEVLAGIEAVIAPRRGGPRMVDAAQRDLDRLLETDARTTEQVAADALVGVFRLALDADPGTIFGSRRPAVRVVVGERSLASRTGAGHLEDGGESLSIETVERLICDTGVIALSFDDDGKCLNVGRTQRLFTQRQRIALSVRDGGCRIPHCDRPPSWTEAHHIEHWHRDNGKTDVADGILLCRRHHMLLHNKGWSITRDGAQYLLTLPTDVDPLQRRIPMPSKSRAFERQAS